MLNETTLSLILFKLAIFSLLCYKCFQLLKAYGLPKLQQVIAASKQENAALIYKDQLAMVAKQKIQNQIDKQNQLLLVLELNMRRWHQAQLAEATAQKEAIESLISKQRAKHAEQQKRLFLAQTMAAITPQALDIATKSFANGHHEQAAYLQDVIAQLNPPKERSS